MEEFTGDCGDANDEAARPESRRSGAANHNKSDSIDSVKLWLKDAEGNMLAEVNRGINNGKSDAAKFQIPRKDGYQLNLRITHVNFGYKKTWENVFDGDEDDGVFVSAGAFSSRKNKLSECK